MGMLYLSNRGNPDFGQDPQRPLHPDSDYFVNAETVGEASDLARAYIERLRLGGGNWVSGRLYVKNKQGELIHIGHVSYNGRVWDVGDNEANRETLLSDMIPPH